MKEETQPSLGDAGNHGGGVFASGRKWALGAKKGIETALCKRTTGTDWKKVLANRSNRKKITKKPHAGRRHETIWEIPIKSTHFMQFNESEMRTPMPSSSHLQKAVVGASHTMNRRRFLAVTSAAAVTLPLAGLRGASAPADGPLAAHRIASLETASVPLTWPRHVGKNAILGSHGNGPTATAAILKTNQGAVGWAEMPGGKKSADALRGMVAGKSVAELFDPASGILDPKLRSLDVALHDLAGVILGQPVWKMLGAEKPHIFPVYSGMIYFDDLYPDDKPAGIDQVLKNCAADREIGYRQLKVKIGRGHRWLPPEAGLQRDIEVVRTIAKAFPDAELLVDGNSGFTADQLIAFLEGIAGIPLFWIEEPFVENEPDWRKVHAWTKSHGRAATLLADGEQDNNYPVLEKLEADGILNVRLCDIFGYGFTPWRALMPRLIKTRTMASPHAWGSGLKTIYAAHLVGGLGNAATIEGVTCSHDHVDFGENVIREGKQQLSTKPGFGLTLRNP
jgi:L-alanine-DL-glutamate epimerase-like enolase superfamily enzyme